MNKQCKCKCKVSNEYFVVDLGNNGTYESFKTKEDALSYIKESADDLSDLLIIDGQELQLKFSLGPNKSEEN